MTVGVPENSLTNDYALAAIPARYALERGQWAEDEATASDEALKKLHAEPAVTASRVPGISGSPLVQPLLIPVGSRAA